MPGRRAVLPGMATLTIMPPGGIWLSGSLKCATCLPPFNRGRFKQEAAVLISLVAPVVAPGTTGVALSEEGLGADIQ